MSVGQGDQREDMAVMQRRVDRKVQRFPIRLSLHEVNGRPAPDSYLVDISSLGAQLETPFFMALNAPVEFVVRFPWGDKETRLMGLLKWIKPLIGKPGRFRLGMRFHNAFWELDMLAREGKL
jgi:PilZ domain